MSNRCKGAFGAIWFKVAMRSAVCLMNFVAWYLINYELIEYWINPMDKFIMKFIVSTLAIMIFLSFSTAVMRKIPEIPIQRDPELMKSQCWKCKEWHNRENCWKPERTKHCSTSKQCVPLMDHYCPWVGNCIGYHNLKPFICYVTYQSIATGTAIVLIIQRIVWKFKSCHQDQCI